MTSNSEDPEDWFRSDRIIYSLNQSPQAASTADEDFAGNAGWFPAAQFAAVGPISVPKPANLMEMTKSRESRQLMQVLTTDRALLEFSRIPPQRFASLPLYFIHLMKWPHVNGPFTQTAAAVSIRSLAVLMENSRRSTTALRKSPTTEYVRRTLSALMHAETCTAYATAVTRYGIRGMMRITIPADLLSRTNHDSPLR